jgi:Flp pilus assembly protein TadD
VRALELSPDFVEAHVGLAKIELGNHQPEKAVTELERAIQLQPKNASAHYTLMLAYRDLGRRQEAVREMAVFRNLKAEENKDFRSELQALLAGQEAEPEKSR